MEIKIYCHHPTPGRTPHALCSMVLLLLTEQLAFDDFQESCAVRWQKYPFRQCVRYWGLGPCVLPHTKDFSRASCYQLALEQVHSHPKAQGALGPLLNIHYLKLTNKHNFVDIADAKLKIPSSGSKSESRLHISSSRSAPFRGGTLMRSS